MPYIKESDRERLQHGYDIDEIITAGELNYVITIILKKYINRKGECYQTYNDIVGALENCKQECYRRMIAPYEDIKIKENGDVHGES